MLAIALAYRFYAYVRMSCNRGRLLLLSIYIACGCEGNSLEKLTMSILRYFPKVPSVEPEPAEIPAPHGSEEASVACSWSSHCIESITPTHIAPEVYVDISK